MTAAASAGRGRTARLAAYLGTVACVALVVALGAPYVLITDPGTGLTLYYAAGPIGAAGVAFLALVGAVGFLAGERGSADPATAAGVVLALGAVTLGLAAVWALAVDPGNVMSFPAAWMGWHRWLVVALAGLVGASAVWYARAVL